MAPMAAYASEGGERGFDPLGAIASLFGLGIDSDDVSVPLAANDSSTVTDANTLGNWENGLRDSTENVGRIWTDKTVEDSDITLSPSPITIKKGDADFLVGLSALSSTSNLTTTASTPLDIVLVLDTSGSMDESMGDPVYKEVTDVQETSGWSFAPDYYVKQGDGYVQVTEKRTINGFWGWEHVGWEVNGQAVEPKTDQNPNGVQFYQYIQPTRLDALQKAVNDFIDETAKANESITDSANKHSISIVTFASSANTRAELTTVDDEHVEELKNTVNRLEANGSTAADYGMQHAQNVLEGARENSQKVVIFFTDGEPNHQNGFDNEVAADTVNAAHSIKQDDTLIYSVGVMEGSDPNGTDDYNSYMNAVSSNYPNATAQGDNGGFLEDGYFTITWGDRVADASYYKAADNADDLNSIFEDIFEEISTGAGLPTRVEGGDPSHGGYLTFSDQLGAYMEIDPSNMTVVYANQSFANPTSSTDGKVTTYHFKGTVETGNPDYAEGNMADLIVEVEHSNDMAAGDVITVKIPAALIPLRTYEVDTTEGSESFTTNEAYPICVFYGVSLKDEAASSLADPDVELQSYIDSNKDENGNVRFYSNLYEKTDGVAGDAEHGNTTATFEPAEGNSFYYLTANTPVYVDETCSTPAMQEDLANFDTFYYQLDHYEKNAGALKKQTEVYSFPSSSLTFLGDAIGFDAAGNAYVKAGQPRLTYIKNFSDKKAGNETDTASAVVSPEWVNEQAAGVVNSYLGNNGLLLEELPGTLAISKDVTVPEGIDEEDHASTQFAFEIVVADAANKNFDAVVKNVQGDIQGNRFTLSFDDQGKAVFEIADGQTLLIYGLSDGWKYTVTETNVPQGFTSQSTGETGVVSGGATTTASFVNTYKVTSATLDGSVCLTGTKAIDGRNWLDTDEFEFSIHPASISPEGTPTPENTKVTVKGSDVVDKTGAASFSFGDIVYTKPGTYTYVIREDATAAADIPGITRSQAQYLVTVKVTDNGQGALEASSQITQLFDDAGNRLDSPVATTTASFINAFSADDDTVVVNAFKNYTDNSGSRPMSDGDFLFELKPTNKSSDDAPDVPMPADVSPGQSMTASIDAETGTVSFGELVFTGEHVGFTYTYEIREVTGNTPAMAYDDTVYTMEVAVSAESDGSGGTRVVATRTLTRDGAPVTDDESILFSNEYRPDPAVLEGGTALGGTKVLTGRDWTEEDTFTFTLEPADATASAVADGVVQITESSATANASGVDFAFGSVHFAKAGTYTFRITEDVPEGAQGGKLDGIVYDTHACDVTVVVGLDADNGRLAVESVTYDNGEGAVDNSKAVFENSYKSGIDYGDEGGLSVSKTLNGRAMNAGEFGFTISGIDNESTSAEEANIKLTDDDKSFANAQSRRDGVPEVMKKLQGLVFDQDDAGKTYSFIVDETPGIADRVTYDASQYRVDVSVEDDGKGAMHAKTTVVRTKTAGGDPVNEIVYGPASTADANYVAPAVSFKNEYAKLPVEAELSAVKQVIGAPYEGSFDFTLTLVEGDRNAVVGLDENGAATAVAAGPYEEGGSAEASFGKLTFTAEGTFVFSVVENDPGERAGWTWATGDGNAKTITVNVNDDGDGRLDARIVGNNPIFVNSYEASPAILSGDAALAVQKSVEGSDTDGDFTFTLAPVDPENEKWQAVDVESGGNHVSIEGPFAAGEVKVANFGDIAFREAGTYQFTVVEDQAAEGQEVPPGWIYDASTSTITVEVTDEGNDGQLDAAVSYANEGKNKPDNIAAFTNSYSVAPTEGVPANFRLTKTFEGREWTDDYVFQFGIEAVTEGAPMPESDTVTVGKPAEGVEAAFDFGEIVYTKAGTYVYKVFEIAGDNAGIVYDGHEATVTVTVVDNHDGTLSSIAAVANGAFSNAYQAELPLSQRANVSISKTLTGRDMEAGQFEFTVKPLDELSADRLGISAEGRVVPSEAAADGEVALMPLDFDGLTFTADDSGKRYGFVVTETKGGGAGYANDDENATVTFDVTDDGNGLLAVTITVLKGDDKSQTVTVSNADNTVASVVIPFANSYAATGVLGSEGDAAINASKMLTGRDLVEGEFSFQVVDAKGNVVATGTNAADGTIDFSAISYSSNSFAADVASGIATKTEMGYEYVYEVSEITDALADSGITPVKYSFAVVVRVTDNGDGTLGIAVDYGSEGNGLTFWNVYDAQAISKSIDGRKVIDGGGFGNAPTQEDIAGAYTFTLTGFAADDGTPAPMPQGTGADGTKTVVNDMVGNVSFGEIEYTVANVWPEGQAADEAGEAVVTATRAGATRSKTFTYSVTEAGEFAGVVNEGGVKTFAVTVTDNGDGTLSAVTDPAAGALFTFTNVYGVDPVDSSLTGEGGVPVAKSLTGRDLVEGEFSFELRDAVTGEVVAVAANAADGTVEMPALTFDAAGTYAYWLSEAPGDRGGVTYDDAVYDVTATVTDDGAGSLDVAWSVEKGGEAFEAVTFRNSYAATPASIALDASKSLTGRDLVEGEFSFELRDAVTGEVVAVAANAADGSISFGRIEYDEAGTYEYEIAEAEGDVEGVTYDDTVFAVRVDVTDDGDGHLSAADWSYGENGAPVFENVYEGPSAPQAAAPETPKPLPGGSLVQTGDATPMWVAVGAALAAVVVACVAALRLRRTRRSGRHLH